MNLEIEEKIFGAIFTEKNIVVWDNYKINIINNLNIINFNKTIENYIPCNHRLYVTRPRMREILYHYIVSNKNIFLEVGYNKYRPKEQYNIEHQDIYNFIEKCIKILVRKQQDK